MPPAAIPDAIAILHVTAAEGGGADRTIRDLARTTAARHWILHAGANVLEDVAAHRYWQAPEGDALASWLREAGIGLLHLHGVNAGCAAVLPSARRAPALPWIVTLHDVSFVAPRAFDGELDADPAEIARVRPVLDGAAAVIAPSRYIAALANAHFPGVDVRVIAPGIDAAQAAGNATLPVPDAAKAFRAAARNTTLAVIGAVGTHKGSDALPAMADALAAQDASLVVIGYTESQLEPGWAVPGKLYVHGPYEDVMLPALLDAYDVDFVLFPNRLPESFSYTLSEAWASGRPVIVPDAGALGERVAQCGGGWRLPAPLAAADVASLLARLAGPGGAHERAQVESAIRPNDPLRVPALATMTETFDRLYAQLANPRGARADGAGDDDGDEARAAMSLTPLIAANLDGFVFRRELVRLTAELAGSRAWRDKLEGDIAELKAAIERLAADNRQLAEYRDVVERAPQIARRLLYRWARRDRG